MLKRSLAVVIPPSGLVKVIALSPVVALLAIVRLAVTLVVLLRVKELMVIPPPAKLKLLVVSPSWK